MAYTARRMVTVKQLAKLVEYMEAHTPLARGRVRTKEVRYTKDKMWRDLSATLNCEGPKRTSQEWNKFWNELKYKVKNKAIKVKLAQRELQNGTPYSGGELSPLEQRVLKIICPDVKLLDTKKESVYLLSEDDTNDNDTHEDINRVVNQNFTDFIQVKVQALESDSESDNGNTSENPLNHDANISAPLKELEEPSRRLLPTPFQTKSRTEEKSPNLSKKSRQICRKFKRKEILSEFDIFANHVASQLRLLSSENSIQAQAEIQNILTRYRLQSVKNGMSSSGQVQAHHLEFIETYYSEGNDEMNGSP